MCYSAMVKRDLGKLSYKMRASIDEDAFIALHVMREKGLNLKIPYGLSSYFIEKGGAAGKAIEKSCDAFQKRDLQEKKAELKEIDDKLKELEAKLKLKKTKTNQKAFDSKSRVREKALQKIKEAESIVEGNERTTKDSYRIYPYSFAPVVISQKGKRLLVPMRFRAQGENGLELPTNYNTFNARRDSILGPTEKKFWKPLFGHTHAIFAFEKFFEWVPKPGSPDESIEVSFNPDGHDGMWAASLYREWKMEKGIYRSFAMVTDDPPPEVKAAGHDRCPVYLHAEVIDEWLVPGKKSLKELDALLGEKEKPYYSHLQVAA